MKRYFLLFSKEGETMSWPLGIIKAKSLEEAVAFVMEFRKTHYRTEKPTHLKNLSPFIQSRKSATIQDVDREKGKTEMTIEIMEVPLITPRKITPLEE